MKNNKGCAPILIALMIVGVLALGGGTYYFLLKKAPKPVACTQEAKICPDGSAVGRTGPNCEFAECPEKTIAEELADCLPKSDTASHEKCNQLLSLITSYGQCADAGFQIIKSNPSQCQTPDGRTFFENDIFWQEAVSLIEQCEVEKTMQTHDLAVTLTLKNGNKVRTVEPTIDEIYSVYETVSGKCGKILMGTE
jgi:hypothetical protein